MIEFTIRSITPEEYINNLRKELEKLLKFVKEGNEVHMEFEPHRTIIEVMPWKPFEYKCPYKEE